MTSGRGDTIDSHTRRRSGRASKVLGWLSIFMCAVLVVSSLTAYAAYRKLAGNLSHQQVALGSDRPDDASEAVNILLLGSDTRSAEGTQQYGTVSGARSDTVILLHLPPGHDRATMVSFPRDSVVEIPSCKQPDGTMSDPIETRLNAAFTFGGPACTWKTIESLTDIHIDHFVMVNFAGFKQTVNALGGVRVCLPVPVNDPKSGLQMAAGPHVVRGEEALGFVRVRHGIGDGSDLGRIQRQQEFLAGMVKKATSKGLLLNPPKLFRFLDAATKTLTTDAGFGLHDLQRLAMSARNIKPSDVNFVTVPVFTRADGATLAWKQPEASQLFQAISGKAPQQGAGGASPGTTPTVPPRGLQVTVLNGTNVSGLAGRTAEKLEARGFEVVKVGNAEAPVSGESVIRHDPELEASANILGSAVSVDEIEADEELGRSVTLVLGEDATSLRVHHGPTPSPGTVSSPTPAPTGSQGSGGKGKEKSSPVPEGVEAINASESACKTSALQ